EGTNIAIIATGTMVYYGLQIAEKLQKINILCRVVDMHTIKPIDKAEVLKACNTELIVSIEEHSIIGGLGSAISEILSSQIKKPPQLCLGIADEFKYAASYDYLLDACGLTTEKMIEKILEKYQEVKK
ncbi:MAG: transketolase C-terminal domain-containing protein, partial [Eubacterium sp.]